MSDKHSLKKLYIIHIVFFIVLLIFVEIFSYFLVYDMYKDVINANAKVLGYKPALAYNKAVYPSYQERKKYFRPVSKANPDKQSIAIFGCSFTWGSFMKDNETFSALLSRYTDRTVYNRGLFGTGVPFLYYQLSDKNIQNEIKNPKYIIYTLIDDHFYRSLTVRSWCKDPMIQYRYKLKNGKLNLVRPVFKPFYPLYSVFLLQKYFQDKEYWKGEFKDSFIKMIDESNKLIKEKFPQAEFIILVYQDKSWDIATQKDIKQEILKHFEDEGIKVVYTDDLIGKGTLNDPKYISGDNFHPSPEAWKLITPKLVEALNMY